MTKDGPALIVNVYMPTEYGTADCYDNYRDVCAKLVLCLMILMQHIYLLWVILTAIVTDHHGFLISFLSSHLIIHYCVQTETV